MENLVCLVRSKSFDEKGIRDTLFQALDIIGYKPPHPVKSVLIKPNLCYYWDYSTGETTDPRLVASLIDYIRERWSSETNIRIVESDASAMRTKHAFRMLGYEDLAENKSVELVNLSIDKKCDKEVTIGKHSFTLSLPHSVLSSEVLINIPKLKIGPYASGRCLYITCASKNLFGCISNPMKVQFHPFLHEVIVGVNKLIKPTLTVVDGIVALGRHPVKLGLVIAGRENLAVDFVAARVMGYNPWRIKHLRLAAKESVGIIQNLRLVGENLQDVRKLFPKRSRLRFRISWAMKILLLSLYLRASGDVVPTILEKCVDSD